MSTPTPPPLPEAATTQDADGATAFVHHWFDVANYGYETGDGQPLVDLSTASCQSCADLNRKIQAVHNGGKAIRGDALVVVTAVSPPPQDGVVAVSTVFHSGEFDVVDTDGTVTTQPAGRRVTGGSVLRWEGDRWLMAGMGS